MIDVIITVLVIGLLMAEIVYFIKLPDIQEKRRLKKLKEQCIEKRWVVQNCHFGLYKTVNDDKYYLASDGKFYNTAYAVQEYKFDTKDEMEEYIKLHMDDFKEKYGDDIQIQRFERRKCIGECKVLEQ